jgi:hypothetical protein
MITYLYWALVVGLAAGLLVFGWKTEIIKSAVAGSILVLVAGSIAYYFHFQQIFVKRWGGVMSISVPAGQFHISATWKDENLWIENYDPETNTCHFNEYSRGNLLQGRVTIKNCNPLILRNPRVP